MQKKIKYIIGATVVIILIIVIAVFIVGCVFLEKDNQIIHIKLNPKVKQESRLLNKINKDTIRILSIDGGGVRGLVSLEVIKYIEAKSGKPIAELFDVVASASVGSMITNMLIIPNQYGQPKYSAVQLAELMSDEKRLKKVFEYSYLRNIVTVDGFFGAKFSGRGKTDVLNEQFRGGFFNELLLPSIVMSYSPIHGQPVVMRNWSKLNFDCRDSKIEFATFSWDQEHHRSCTFMRFPVSAIVNMATTAPTVFPPIKYIYGDHNELILMDAAIFDNDPVINAIFITKDANPRVKKIILVSIGTGRRSTAFSYKQIKNSGILFWVRYLPSIQSNLSTYDKDYLYNSLLTGNIDFYRFNSKVAYDDTIMNISPETIKKLKASGQSIVKENKQRLDKAIKELIADD